MKNRTGRLDIQWMSNGSEHRARFDGQIDERCELATLAEEIEGQRLVIDLEKVSFINSIGVREWIRMLRNLRAREISVVLRNCSEALVQQMNMIVEAQAGTTIESFFAPYDCDGCGAQLSMPLDVAANRELLVRQEPPSMPCPECGDELVFSELPDRYLLFLQHGGEP